MYDISWSKEVFGENFSWFQKFQSRVCLRSSPEWGSLDPLHPQPAGGGRWEGGGGTRLFSDGKILTKTNSRQPLNCQTTKLSLNTGTQWPPPNHCEAASEARDWSRAGPPGHGANQWERGWQLGSGCREKAPSVSWGLTMGMKWGKEELKRLCDGQPTLVRAVQKLPNAGEYPLQVFPKGTVSMLSNRGLHLVRF